MVPGDTASLALEDTFITDQQADVNRGYQLKLVLQHKGRRRVLIRVAPEELAKLSSPHVERARLHLPIRQPAENFGPDPRSISLHRMLRAWSEYGATFTCSDDVGFADLSPERVACPEMARWNMEAEPPIAFSLEPTAQQVIAPRQSGVIEFDVTHDLNSVLAGRWPNYGWLLKLSDEAAKGKLELHSSQSDEPPRLTVTTTPEETNHASEEESFNEDEEHVGETGFHEGGAHTEEQGEAGRGDTCSPEDCETPSEPIQIRFYEATAWVKEGRSYSFYLELAEAATEAVRVTVALVGGTADSNDHNFTERRINFAPGETFKVITIAIAGDVDAEPNETVQLALTEPSVGEIDEPSTLTLTIEDRSPIISFRATGTITEPEYRARAYLQLEGDAFAPITLRYQIVPGTATAGADYQARNEPYSLTLCTGCEFHAIDLPVLDDRIFEAHETLTLRLVDADHARIGAHRELEVVLDDDEVMRPQFAFAVSKGVEGKETVAIIKPQHISALPFEVEVGVTGGTASQDDFTLLTPRVAFAAGQEAAEVRIQVHADAEPEGVETIKLSMVDMTLGNPADLGTKPFVLSLYDAGDLRIVSTPPSVVFPGEDVEYAIHASTVGGDPLTDVYYGLRRGPEGMILPLLREGVVKWRAPLTPSTEPCRVEVFVTTADGSSLDTQVFDLYVLSLDVIASNTITPDSGGTVAIRGTGTIMDGVKIEFEPGSVTKSVEVQLAFADHVPADTSEETEPVGPAITILPWGLALQKPYRLIVPYDRTAPENHDLIMKTYWL